MKYSSKVLYYFDHTPHAGILRGKAGIQNGKASSQTSGESIQFYVNIVNGCMVEIRFQAAAHIVGIASAEYLASQYEGKSVNVVGDLKAESLLRELELAETQINSVTLAINALRNAVASGA